MLKPVQQYDTHSRDSEDLFGQTDLLSQEAFYYELSLAIKEFGSDEKDFEFYSKLDGQPWDMNVGEI